MFEWAVERKKKICDILPGSTMLSSTIATTSSKNSSTLSTRYTIPPLRSVRFSTFFDSIEKYLFDLLFAFQDTLEFVTIDRITKPSPSNNSTHHSYVLIDIFKGKYYNGNDSINNSKYSILLPKLKALIVGDLHSTSRFYESQRY